METVDAPAATTAVDDAVSIGGVGVASYERFTIMLSSSLLLLFVPLRFIVLLVKDGVTCG